MNRLNRQSGVLIIITPFLIVFIGLVSILAMDAARLYGMRGEMQRIANAAATAAADDAQTCGAGDLQAMQTRALIAARQLGFQGEDAELEVFAGVLDPSAPGSETLRFTSRPAAEIAQTNAALVRYTRHEPTSRLLPSAWFEPIELSVNAASRKELYATLSGAASTLTVEEGLLGNLLGAVLGQENFSLDPTDLASLEATLINVGSLLDVLGLDDVTQLMDEPLINVLDGVVTLTGGVGSPVGGLVDQFSGAAGLDGLDASAVLQVAGSPDAAMNAEFPLYDFLISVVMNSLGTLSDQGSLLNLSLDTNASPLLSGLLADNPLLGDIDVALNLGVGNPAPIVIGPARQNGNGEWTKLTASDITLELVMDLELSVQYLGDLLSLTTLGLVDVEILDKIRVPVVVQVGGGSAEFIGADCARGSSNLADLEILATGSVANVVTGSLAGDGSITPESIHATIMKLELSLLGLLSTSLVELCVDAELSANVPTSGGQQYVLDYALHCSGGDCVAPFAGAGMGDLAGLDLQVDELALDCGAGGITGAVSSFLGQLTPLVETLLNLVTEAVLKDLVSPLLALLGGDLAGLNVRLVGADQLGSQLIENVEF